MKNLLLIIVVVGVGILFTACTESTKPSERLMDDWWDLLDPDKFEFVIDVWHEIEYRDPYNELIFIGNAISVARLDHKAIDFDDDVTLKIDGEYAGYRTSAISFFGNEGIGFLHKLVEGKLTDFEISINGKTTRARMRIPYFDIRYVDLPERFDMTEDFRFGWDIDGTNENQFVYLNGFTDVEETIDFIIDKSISPRLRRHTFTKNEMAAIGDKGRFYSSAIFNINHTTKDEFLFLGIAYNYFFISEDGEIEPLIASRTESIEKYRQNVRNKVINSLFQSQ